MKRIKTDVAVIGGGPAGLAAALEARRLGAETLLIERDHELGGILQQCIHDGFGLLRYGERLSGCQYAQRYIDDVESSGVQVLTDTMVLDLTPGREVIAVNSSDGMVRVEAGAIILCMGCRERTRSQVFILGTRPAGVYTAGVVQRFINMEGFLPGRRAVILGSGDIGLIMARRMTLEGIEVEGVYEVMPNPGGLTRNIVQCLEDYDIPLHLSHTVVKVHGKKRVEGVTVARAGADMKPVPGTERHIDCDLLVLSVGLIPENELTQGLDIEMDPVTRGPVVDADMMTSAPGIFAAGNAVAVFDLVDYVSETGVCAARGAVKFIRGEHTHREKYVPTVAGENVLYVLPQRVAPGSGTVDLYMRARRPLRGAAVTASAGAETLLNKRYPVVAPPEMVHVRLQGETAGAGSIRIDIRGEVV
jgi:NADPH-dependent 2,4-dienoyl-CoA reductase/sulfur reductase-like enzyme